MYRQTIIVSISLALSTLLIGMVAYQQFEIASLVARNDDLLDSLKKTSGSLNSVSSDLSSLLEDYSALLESYNNLQAKVVALQNSVDSLSATLEHLNKPIVFFDKSIYYPDQEVFWNQSDPAVPIMITVIDKDTDFNYVAVEVLSSCDSEEVVLKGSLLEFSPPPY